MWGWIVGFFAVLLISMGVFFVFVTGGNYYLRAIQRIYAAPQADREQMKVNLFASDHEFTYGGIYSGVYGGKIWIWGTGGLKPFAVDQYSAYLLVDGCSEAALSNAKKAVPDRVPPNVVTSLDSWRDIARKGDYIVVVITTPEMGGTEGNLREIHSYNYWPFLHGPMEALCAK